MKIDLSRFFSIQNIFVVIFFLIQIPAVSLCDSMKSEDIRGYEYKKNGYNYGDVYDFITARLCEDYGLLSNIKNIEEISKKIDDESCEYSSNGWIIIWSRSKEDNKIVLNEVIAGNTKFLDNTLKRLMYRFNHVDKKQVHFFVKLTS